MFTEAPVEVWSVTNSATPAGMESHIPGTETAMQVMRERGMVFLVWIVA